MNKGRKLPDYKIVEQAGKFKIYKRRFIFFWRPYVVNALGGAYEFDSREDADEYFNLAWVKEKQKSAPKKTTYIFTPKK